MNSRQFGLVAWAAGLILLLAACGRPSQPSAVSSSGWSVLYWKPGAAVGSVFMQESAVVSGGQTATGILVGLGNDVSAVQTHTFLSPPNRRALVGSDGTGNIHDMGASTSELTTSWSWRASSIAPAMIDQSGTVFESRGGLRVVATHRNGTTVTYDLRGAAGGTPTLDGGPVKGALFEGSSVVALAPGANGEVFVFVSNGVNSLIAGLNSKAKAPLGQYGVILDAVTGADGQLEVLAYDPRLSTNDIQLLSIDPVSLKIGKTIDSGVNPRSGGVYLHTHSIVATPSAVFMYVVLQSTPPAAVQESTYLLKVANGGASPTRVPVSDSAGLDITVGSDAKIYLFGGPARNRVSVVDPTSGSVSVDASLSSPDGSFVRAVFV